MPAYLIDEHGFRYAYTAALAALPNMKDGGACSDAPAQTVNQQVDTSPVGTPPANILDGTEGKPLDELADEQLRALALEWKLKLHPKLGRAKIISAITDAMTKAQA